MNQSQNTIISAFKELISHKDVCKISVEEIISHANVSRQTFYKYFPDKYAVAFALFQQDHANAVNEDDDFVTRQRCHLKMLKDGQAYYKNLMKDSHIQNSFMQQRFEYCVQATIDVIGKKQVDQEMYLVLSIWITGTEKAFENWVLSGCKDDPELILNGFLKSMPDIVRPYLL